MSRNLQISRRGSFKARLIIALIIAAVSAMSYCSMNQENPITGERQRVAMSEKDEIALGLHAAPKMVQQHGGLHPDPRGQAHVDRVGGRLLGALDQWLASRNPPRKNPFPFEFHLLRDNRTINAFALPGGQVFITEALYRRLQTEGQLAGVIGHEIGHVLSRHGAQRLAKEQLTQGLVGAVGVAGGNVDSARLAQAVGQLVNMRYGREDELESDSWGVRLCTMAGYNPEAMYGVMDVLEQASKGGGPPEFMSTHPKPANRKDYVRAVIEKEYPEGLPPNLEP
jgi:predicted Zn-dependent protease